MSYSQETTTSKTDEAREHIVTLSETLDAVEFDDSNLEVTHDLTVKEVQAFADAHNLLKSGKEKVNIDALDKQQIAMMIDRVKSGLATEMDERREQERRVTLTVLQDAYDRIGHEVGDVYEAVVMAYIDEVEALPKSDKPLLLKDAPHGFVTARLDLLTATDQMQIDALAYEFLYRATAPAEQAYTGRQ